MDPVLYHAHHSRHGEDIPFWRDMAAARGSPVLELGCGTGRVLLPLAAEGHAMVGLDHDPVMLGFLRDRLQGANDPLIVQSDLRIFAFGIQFPLIILPCNTLSTLPAPDRKLLFLRVQKHLAPQGWFVASLPNPKVLADLPPVGEPKVEEIFPHPNAGESVQVSSAWERSRDRMTITWGYDRLRKESFVHHTTLDQVHYIFPVPTLMTELEEAGLKLVEMFGDYDRSPYESDAPYCIPVVGPAP